MKITWKQSERRYGQSYDCFVGPYVVASVHWDATSTKGDPLVWLVKFDMPAREGEAWKSRSFAELNKAKAYIEALINVWFEEAQKEDT